MIGENATGPWGVPETVVVELRRVLKLGGRLFLHVGVFQPLSAAIHGLLAITRLNPLHPASFTLASPSRRLPLLARLGMVPILCALLAEMA